MDKHKFSRLFILATSTILLISLAVFGLVACDDNDAPPPPQDQKIIANVDEAFEFSEDGKTVKGFTAEYKNAAEVYIPDYVERIDDSAFSCCVNLSVISLPDSIKSIGSYAFDATAWYDNQPDGLVYLDNWLLNYKSYNEEMPENSEFNIKDGTIGIADSAFYMRENLLRITMPCTVKGIGADAFSQCTNLTSITIPKGVIRIEERAFRACSNLKYVDMSDSVSEMGRDAFYGCGELLGVSLSNNIKIIAPHTFCECYKLLEINLPENLEYIDYNAFDGCRSLKEIIIPDKVTHIGESAFRLCQNAKTLSLPSGLKKIGNSAFMDCRNLSDILFPDGLTEIDSLAFFGCTAITDITIPKTVVTMGNGVFDCCYNLVRIKVMASEIPSGWDSKWKNTCYAIVYYNDIPTDADKLTLSIDSTGILCLCGIKEEYAEITELVIPKEVGIIKANSFEKCDKLKRVTISASVRIIEEGAFVECSNLEEIIVEEENQYYNVQKDCLVETINEKIIATFGDCQIPENLSYVYIGAYAFSGKTNLENVIIPDSVHYIYEYAFEYCSNLKSITLPKKIYWLEDGIFFNCSNLTDIYYDGTIDEWNAIPKGLHFTLGMNSCTVHCTNGTIEL